MAFNLSNLLANKCILRGDCFSLDCSDYGQREVVDSLEYGPMFSYSLIGLDTKSEQIYCEKTHNESL